jgi:hypothetical protein
VKLSNASKLLAVTLLVYAVGDVLLTPVGHLETRPVAKVTILGFATLALLFVGLALAVVALVLVLRRSGRGAIVAVASAVLYFPAAVADQLGWFSSLRPPTAIATLEVAQSIVAIIAIALSAWIRSSPETRSSS